MTANEFIVWFHGYLEISGTKTLGGKELQVVKDHMDEFFIKVTPAPGGDMCSCIEQPVKTPTLKLGCVCEEQVGVCSYCEFIESMSKPIVIKDPWDREHNTPGCACSNFGGFACPVHNPFDSTTIIC